MTVRRTLPATAPVDLDPDTPAPPRRTRRPGSRSGKRPGRQKKSGRNARTAPRPRWRRRLWLALALLALLALVPPAASWAWVESRAAGRITGDPARVRPAPVALVLGTSPGSRDHPNPYFEHRMDAAAALHRAGKVRTLLVSGDNREVHYNEVAAMRRALIARGVPAAAIQGDDAGLRTLDSVLRARSVFRSNELIVVSQHFHAARAIAIARHHGIEARGFAAADVPHRDQVPTLLREIGARMKMVWDLYVAHTAPPLAE